jgi:hypothetical protein
MIRYKDGVTPDGLRSDIKGLLKGFEQIWHEHGHDVLTITDTTDSHPEDDPHTHGFAVDMRVHDYPVSEQELLAREIHDFVGPRYFSQLEFSGTDKAHIHVQLRKDLWHAIVAAERA